MQYVYLGFVEKLQELFGTIFKTIFAPILSDVLEIFINYVTSIIWNLWSEYLIGIFSALCAMIDFVEGVFNIFSGVSPVLVSEQKMTLLQALFEMKGISTAFVYITVMAVAICFIFTIYKTAKSISDMALEDKNPISKVLGDGMKASVTFMLIPFLCVFMLQLSSVITNQAVTVFNSVQGTQGSVGTVVFLTAGMDADKSTTEAKDLGTGVIKMKDGRNPSFSDSIRNPYMVGTKDYRNLAQVRKDFHVANFDYIVGFVSGILLLLVMAGAVLIFVRRIFELLVLYLVSPFFVSTIPLDDGAMFAKWRELFIAKFFSGFGTIFSMKYYMMLVPMLTSSKLCLYDTSLPHASVINSVLRIFLIVGGAWAVYKSQSLILEILSPEAGMAEKQTAAMLTAMLTGMIVGGVSTAATIATGGAAGAAGAAMGAMGAVAGAVKSGQDENQAYRG